MGMFGLPEMHHLGPLLLRGVEALERMGEELALQNKLTEQQLAQAQEK